MASLWYAKPTQSLICSPEEVAYRSPDLSGLSFALGPLLVGFPVNQKGQPCQTNLFAFGGGGPIEVLN